MLKNQKWVAKFFSVIILSAAFSASAQNLRSTTNKGLAPASVTSANAVLWREPADISTRDLFYGSGGKEHAPTPGFEFIKEDTDGTNPKFEVRDMGGVKWKAKLGMEAQPEIAAARIVWAIGYDAPEDYLVPVMHAQGMLPLKRGQRYVHKDGSILNVRLKRNEGKKEDAVWKWRDNPFTNTRELNGLRVAMALINNWDLKDENNAVFENKKGDKEIYEVSDLGAAFGAGNLSFPFGKSKGNLNAYRESHFITKTTADYVDFGNPGGAAGLYMIFKPGDFFARRHLTWIGHHIPRADAKWIGGILAKLTPEQIHDAFRAAGYTPQQIDAFSSVVMARIAELNRL